VVFCDACRTARLDGPQYCPACGGPLRAVAGATEGPKKKPSEAFTLAEPIELADNEMSSVETFPEAKPATCLNPVSLWAQVRESGKLTHNGKSQTIEEWSKELGISIKTIRSRITRGFSVDRVLYVESNAIERRLQGSVHTYTFQGETLSLQEWSERLGMRYATLYSRINMGWPIEKAFAKPLQGEKTLEFQGRTQPIAAWAKELDITPLTIRKRPAKGLSIDRVLSSSRLPPTSRRHDVEEAPSREPVLLRAPSREVASPLPTKPLEAPVTDVALEPYANAAARLRENGVIAPVEQAPLDVLETFRQWRDFGSNLQTRIRAEIERLCNRTADLDAAAAAIGRVLQGSETSK
jgi:hypothetical protein